MDCQWPARRRDSLSTRDSLLIAVSLTGAAAFVAGTPVAMSHAVPRDEIVVPIRIPKEAVTYVPLPEPVRALEPALARAHSRAHLSAPVRALVTAPLTAPSRVSSDSVSEVVPTEVPKALPRAAAPSGAAWLGTAFTTRRELSATDRMAALAENLARPMVNLGGWRLVPQDERSGQMSEEEQRMADARLYEPAAVAGKPGFGVGFLGSGPSREQRRRDSIAHHDNLLRLARIAERAKARQDSARKAVRP